MQHDILSSIKKKSMLRKFLLTMAWFTLGMVAVPAQAALLTIIHALPALPGAMPASNPVDVAIDGVCEHIYEPYGAKLGPKQIAAGVHSIIFYESIPDDPCQSTVLAAAEANLPDTAQIDVVLGLNASDQVIVLAWDNRLSLDDGSETVVEVRHAAGGPTLGAVLRKGDTQVGAFEVLASTSSGPVATTQGEHTLQVRNGLEVLDQSVGDFKADRVYWAYITGSVFKKTVNLLVIESVPGELIEGEEPPAARFSTCCLFGTATQLGQNQCSQAGGTYIGDVDPAGAPCRGVP